MLYILGGLPGVGKSSLGRELARRAGALHLRIDSIEWALAEAGHTDDDDPAGYLVGYAVAADNLRLGLRVVADSVNLCWDLTDPEDDSPFDEETARILLADLPVWARTSDVSEAPRMLAELRALFAFAERTGLIENAEEWRTLVADDTLVERFEDCMRTDRRLRPRSGGRRGTRTRSDKKPARERRKHRR